MNKTESKAALEMSLLLQLQQASGSSISTIWRMPEMTTDLLKSFVRMMNRSDSETFSLCDFRSPALTEVIPKLLSVSIFKMVSEDPAAML